MHKFYFTKECTPLSDDLHDYTNLFESTLRAYNSLLNNSSLEIDSGIITDVLPSELPVGTTFSLRDVINNINDRPLKSLAFAYFLKYPTEDYLEDWENQYDYVEDALYQITIDNNNCELLYLAFVALDDDFGFTVPVHEDLKTNPLNFTSTSTPPEAPLALYHIYEQDIINIDTVVDAIQKLNIASMTLWEQLMNLLNDPIYHERHFEKAFDDLSEKEQKSILRKFQDAINQNAIDNPNSSTVKDVSNDKCKCTVLELRVYTPTALRVYFNKTDGVIYLGSIKKKSNPDQNKDIIEASRILHKLIITNP